MFNVECDSCKNNKFWITSDYFYVCESCGLCVKDFIAFEEDVKYFQRKRQQESSGRCVQEYLTIYHFSQICRRFFLMQNPLPGWMISTVEEEITILNWNSPPPVITKQHIWKALDSLQKKHTYAERDDECASEEEEEQEWDDVYNMIQKDNQKSDTRVMRRGRAIRRAQTVTNILNQTCRKRKKRQWKHLRKYWIHIRYLINGVRPQPELQSEMFQEMLSSFSQLYPAYLYVMTNKDVQKQIGVRKIWPRLAIVAEMILRIKGSWHDNYYEYFETVRSESCVRNYVVIIKGVLEYCNLKCLNHPQLAIYMSKHKITIEKDEFEEFEDELFNKMK